MLFFFRNGREKGTIPMPPHSDIQLQLANACHPSMSGTERHRILVAVARATRHADWMRRLAPRRTANRRTAMTMLDEYEGRSRAQSHRRSGWFLAMLLALLLVVWLSVRGRS